MYKSRFQPSRKTVGINMAVGHWRNIKACRSTASLNKCPIPRLQRERADHVPWRSLGGPDLSPSYFGPSCFTKSWSSNAWLMSHWPLNIPLSIGTCTNLSWFIDSWLGSYVRIAFCPLDRMCCLLAAMLRRKRPSGLAWTTPSMAMSCSLTGFQP